MGKILKEGKWVPHALSEKNKNDRLEKCLNLYNKQHRNSFLWKIMTDDEKWIFTIILKRENIIWIQDNPLHQRQNTTSIGVCRIFFRGGQLSPFRESYKENIKIFF